MNTFGRKFRVSIFGASHGACAGVLIDGIPAGIPLAEEDFLPDLMRRKSGARGTTSRKEDDLPEILSGLFEGRTTGEPMAIVFRNANIRSGDYANLKAHPRPGHADFVAREKFHGFADYRGGGHFSGRLTLGLVAAGTIAKKILKDVEINAALLEVGGSKENFAQTVERAMASRDSVGGIVECVASGVPVGLGEPFFDSAESLISHAVFSIPAIRGIEFGRGFEAARIMGSENNDPIVDAKGATATNNAGGINGGIANGNDIVFRVAVKPTSSIAKPQMTFNFETGRVEELVVRGRHDACIALRVPVVVEAVTAMVLADLLLIASAEGFSLKQ